jgi:phenylacetate-coenzyme A ligase PaaK-like adenylate-forming protein
MSEAGLMGAENDVHDGIHIWTDMFFIEVVDADTGIAVPEGEVGTLCVTPLWTNHATPFLRWNSGDMVRYIDRSQGTGQWAELFPMIRHANRTHRLLQAARRQHESRGFRGHDVLRAAGQRFPGGAGDRGSHRPRVDAASDRG